MALPDGTTCVRIMERALQDGGMTGAQWQVLVGLGTYLYRHGNAYPSNDTLAAFLGLTRQTVNEALGVLRRRGYIVAVGTYKRCVIYTIPGMKCRDGADTTEALPVGTVPTLPETNCRDSADTTSGEVSATGGQETVGAEPTQQYTDKKNPPVVPPAGGTSGVGAGRADTCSLSPCAPSPVAGEGGLEPSRAGGTTLERLAARQSGGGGEKSGAITRARDRLAHEIGAPAAKSWLRPLAITWRGDAFTVAAPTPFMRDHVESRYGPRLRALIGEELGRPVQVQFSVQPQEAANVAVPAG